MTNKELAAQCLIEAANILGDVDNSNAEILEESLFEPLKNRSYKYHQEIKSGLDGKYDDTIIDNEEKLAKFMEKNEDLINKISTNAKKDIHNKAKFDNKNRAAQFIVDLITCISAFGVLKSTGMLQKVSLISTALSVLTSAVNMLSCISDHSDIKDSIRYLKLIKTTLTNDSYKINNKDILNKYQNIINNINRTIELYDDKKYIINSR